MARNYSMTSKREVVFNYRLISANCCQNIPQRSTRANKKCDNKRNGEYKHKGYRSFLSIYPCYLKIQDSAGIINAFRQGID